MLVHRSWQSLWYHHNAFAGTTEKLNADTGQGNWSTPLQEEPVHSTYAGDIETSNIDMQSCVAYKAVKGLIEEDHDYCTVGIS